MAIQESHARTGEARQTVLVDERGGRSGEASGLRCAVRSPVRGCRRGLRYTG